jgi:hypothetical protein
MTLTGALPRYSLALSGIILNIDPNQATIGEVVTLSGVNASSHGEVRIYISSTMFLASTAADEIGSYSINLTIPSLRSNTYDIMALDVSTGDTSIAKLSIQPKITLTPNIGSYRDIITVRGEGFQIFNPITITFNGSDVTPSPQPLPDSLGFFEADFRVPLMPNGSYIVKASDGVVNASSTFDVLPKISLSPQTSGPIGTFIMVTGAGFSPSANLTVEFDTFNVTNYGGVETWEDGSFGIWMVLPALFYVPEVQDGTHIVNATDENGLSATARFIVPSPTLTVTPNVTSGSSRITVSGSGFTPSEPVLIYFEDILMVDILDLMVGSQILFANEFGAYEYSFIVPVEKPGVYSIRACQLADSVDFIVGDELAVTSLVIVEDALLMEIEDEIATIVIPALGVINSNLNEIDAKLVSIQGDTAVINSTLYVMKSNLTTIQAELISIDETLATINSTLGLIKVETSNIRLNIIEINDGIATIYTTLSTLEGRITSIDGNTATIETDIGTVKASIDTIEGSLGTVDGTKETVLTPIYIIAVLSLIAAVGTTILTIMHIQVLRKAEP